jgi:hypothetical protein
MEWCGFTANWPEIRTSNQRPQNTHGVKLAQLEPYKNNYWPDWPFTKFPQISIGRTLNILNPDAWLDPYFRLA